MLVNPARITADVVEANEFPEYSQRYSVWAVPKTVINDRVQFEGALPEDAVMDYLKQAVGETDQPPPAEGE
ncbi:MAG: thioredoxin family protein [Chloroflexi bacterium]|nr:thioredoxin family protein [Chloroflexota bacterium]